MTAQNDLTIDEALKILKEYSCVQMKIIKFELDKTILRRAIQLITSLTDHENLGICADNLQEGLVALKSYLNALNYFPKLDSPPLTSEKTPVYIKFNTKTSQFYVDSYQGNYRGVLISCQSENDTLVGTYGHFPLDLFTPSLDN